MLTALVIAAIFAVGAMVQTVAGFGSALIIMPLLTYFIGIKSAATVMAIAGSAVTVAVLYQNWQGLRWAEAAYLLVGSIVGIPVGTMALKSLPAAPIVALLGVVLLAYALFRITLRNRFAVEVAPPSGNPTWGGRLTSIFVGLTAGLLGGAYATDGPPLVIYGDVKGWPKESFRSILQAVFLVDGILIIAWHGAGGLVSGEVITYSAYGIPGMLVGLGAGIWVDRRVNHELFHKMLLALIILLGVSLIARAVLMG
jgi:uncharacterized membrane protein YfcA